MALTMYHVDAFTDRPFAGNPAAVCLLPAQKDDGWLQAVAQEMNLSETAFLLWESGGFNLRWFTPVTEVDLCGHATLASAHILWEEDYLQPDEEARFQTRSGLLTAKQQGDWIELNFPAKEEEEVEAPPYLLEALGVPARYIGKNVFDYLVEVDAEEVVRAMKPNIALLAKVAARGVMVTSRGSTGEYDFVSRFFAPQVGVNEDPVTGSAHCCLTPYWSKRLHKREMLAYQASARGGILRVRVEGDRVILGGQAVTVMHGELHG